MENQNKNQEEINPIRLDIMMLILLAVCVLIFVSLIGFCGLVGQGVRYILFGLLGIGAFAFPFLLFFTVSYAMANRGNSLFIRKLIGLIGLYLFACAFCQIVMIGFDPTYSVFQCFLDSAEDHLGGGFFGGCIVQLFGTLIGLIGTYIVLIVGMIIFAIILTQKPLYSSMKNGTKEVYDRVRSSSKERREKRYSSDPVMDTVKRRRAEKRRSEEPEGGSGRKKTDKNDSDDIFDSYISRKGKNKEEEERTVRHDTAPSFLLEPEEWKPNNSKAAAFQLKDFKPEGLQDDTVDAQEISFEEEADDLETVAFVPVTAQSEPGLAAVKKPESRKVPEAREKEEPFQISGVDPGMSNPAKKSAPKAYRLPPMNLLQKGSGTNTKELTAQVRETAMKLQQTLHNFGVEATVVNASCGPTVTRYELQPEQGVKVSRIVNLTDDIKLNLAAADIRIEAPIPGKAAIGIEVPNKTNHSVALRELLDSPEFKNSKSKVSFAVGKDLAGKPVVSDIAKMPHLLIAGSTGSGKSVCMNTLIMSILYKAKPDEVKLMMVDPKVVELSVYNGIPHLLCPVVTDPKKAAGALQWAVSEMTRRYNLFAEFAVRDLKGYNRKAEELAQYATEEEPAPEILPQIVIIVDELADLMMASPGEVEEAIVRLTQLARAAGIHLIIATQRPSVNVITGLIKANMPSRIALSVTSGIDSRVILDMNGAEKLLGKGDMLFYPAGYPKPARVQGAFVSDEEIQKVVDFISRKDVEYDTAIQEAIDSSAVSSSAGVSAGAERDVYFADAGRFIIEKDKASIGMLQRVFKIGFNRAARIMDQLCDAGVVGEEEGTKPRKILMSLEQFENYLEENENI